MFAWTNIQSCVKTQHSTASQILKRRFGGWGCRDLGSDARALGGKVSGRMCVVKSIKRTGAVTQPSGFREELCLCDYVCSEKDLCKNVCFFFLKDFLKWMWSLKSWLEMIYSVPVHFGGVKANACEAFYTCCRANSAAFRGKVKSALS